MINNENRYIVKFLGYVIYSESELDLKVGIVLEKMENSLEKNISKKQNEP